MKEKNTYVLTIGRVVLLYLLFVQQIPSEEITDSNSKAYYSVAQALEVINRASTNNVPLVRDHHTISVVKEAFGSDFKAQRPQKKMTEAYLQDIGRIRSGNYTFVKGEKGAETVLRVMTFECDSASAVRKQVLHYISNTYSGGIPTQNTQTGIGDCVLSWQDLGASSNHVSFVVFWNNFGLLCNASIEGEGVISGRELLKGVALWMDNTKRANGLIE